MSLVFTPKIPKTLRQVAPLDKSKRENIIERNPWSEKEIDLLINLRAIGVSYRDCGRILHRSQSTCSSMVANSNLYWRINEKRKANINEVKAL